MSIESELSGLIGDLPDGVTEGVALGTGLADGYDIYESVVGSVAVTFNPMGVSSVDVVDELIGERFSERFGRGLIRAEAPSKWKRRIPDAIEAGRAGVVPVDLRSVTPFQAQVLNVTATIPKGEVRSYAWLAHEVDRPGATRAAGSVMARNPIPLIIPCHRVVRADGHIGNYSLGGPHNKTELLTHEGASPDWLEGLASRHVRVQGNFATRVFCHPTCHVIRDSQAADIVDFHNTRQASEAGYEACEVCRPV